MKWLIMLAALVSTSAQAQENARRTSAGVVLQFNPVGKVKASVGNLNLSADTEPSFAIAPFIDHRVHPNFQLGFSPRFTFNIKGEDSDGESAEQLDLMARATALIPAGTSADFYVMLAGGYSVLLLDDSDTNDGFDNPSGFIVDIGTGARIDLNPSLFAVLGVGYQIGFQDETVAGLDVDFTTRFLHLDAGLGGRF